MSKRANPTLIGAFVVGAVTLLAIAVSIFGGAELFAERTRFVTYFPGSVKGLRSGANVLFRGVRIGEVRHIQLMTDVNNLDTKVQVTIEVFPDSFVLTKAGKVVTNEGNDELVTQEVIDAGLRAQLVVESFVTGQLLVSLDFHPDTPAEYRGRHQSIVEVPSVPSDAQKVIDAVRGLAAEIEQHVDVKRLMKSVHSVLSGLDETVNSPDLKQSLAGLNKLINDKDTQALSTALRSAIADFRLALADIRTLVNHADAEISNLASRLAPALDELDGALQAGEILLVNANKQVSTNSETSYQLIKTLTEVQRAAKSLRILLDYLDQHPEALLRGKTSR